MLKPEEIPDTNPECSGFIDYGRIKLPYFEAQQQSFYRMKEYDESSPEIKRMLREELG